MGSCIRRRRQQLGYSQEELAWRASLHRTYITDVERGVRNLTLRTVEQLARALDVTVAELLRGDIGPAAPLEGVALGEILLVEDNAEDAEIALRAFQRAKLCNPVRSLRDGAAAQAHLEQLVAGTQPLPQLVLLDLHLPRISGLEILRQLRGAERTREIPVTVMTVSRSDRDLRECRTLGVEHYIIKPVTVALLCRIATSLALDWALLPATKSPAARDR